MGIYYKELQMATDNFSMEKRTGQGCFGSVYEGWLNDGTLVAIATSAEVVLEFLNVREILAGRLHYNKREFNWKIRYQICERLAPGIALLVEEVRTHIVHRDIKSSNVLLDEDYIPKLSYTSLARIFPNSITHVNTRVVGTFGYLSPEYVLTGIMTWKSDVYSFGILLLEIICGRPIGSTRLPVEEQNLLARAWSMYKRGELDQLVDKALEGDCNIDKACKYLKIGLLCVQERPAKWPDM